MSESYKDKMQREYTEMLHNRAKNAEIKSYKESPAHKALLNKKHPARSNKRIPPSYMGNAVYEQINKRTK